jgi:uncharacterized protein YijF (DUF1287 family)
MQVGDIVTWRKAGMPNAIGVRGCKVLSLGTSEDGKPAALIEAMGQEVGALVEDLHLED